MNAVERLEKRARELARKEEAPREDHPFTLFRRGGFLCAVPVEELAGAGTLRQLTPVPGGPAHIAGAVFHRGEVLSLLDLPVLWNVQLRGVADMQSYVVLTDGRARVGLLVEDLLGVRELADAPEPWRGEPHAGITEQARFGEETVLVLRVGALLSDPRLLGRTG